LRATTLLNKLVRLPGLSILGLSFGAGTMVVTFRRKFRVLTCPECGTQVRGRLSTKTRRWRHLALGGVTVYLEGPIRRMRCPSCKSVRTERVPWARPGSAFTRPFEDVVGYLAQRLSHKAVVELTGVDWQTVGRIARRLVGEKLETRRFDNLRRIGVDEIAYRRNHKYLTVVVNHDTSAVVWVAEGKSSETLGAFFEEVGTERLKTLEVVSIDLSAAFQKALRESVPHAQIVFDKFHVARLAQKALDEVRRALVRELPADERPTLKKTRWALLRRPDSTPEQVAAQDEATLSEIQKHNAPLYRGYLLKESLMEMLDAPDRNQAESEVQTWMNWAARSRLQPFVRLGRTIRKHLDGILKAVETGLTNARLEGTNNKIRLLSHRAYGFHSAQGLIATIYLCCSGIVLPTPTLA
jgi:transposase